jgi:acetyl-CoA C-acetyltransferase
VCGSGMKAMMIGSDAILAGNADLVVAGGMESMTNSPYVIEKARAGLRMGHAEIVDTMIKDGLWDVYNNQHMGSCAELCAKEFKFTREDQDKFAYESYIRAKAAIAAGKFKDEIVPVEVPQKKGDPLMLAEDEGPKKGGDLAKMATLKPAFQKDGTVTAANASSINDGAAAVVLASEAMAKKLNVKPLARIVAYAGWAEAPEWFTIAPVGAIRKALEKAKLTKDKIDVWEINAAFAVVTMAAMKKFELDHAKVNPNGGAISLGHPIGASGARIMTTLLYEMAAMKAKYGLATLCIGGGEGTALIVERV